MFLVGFILKHVYNMIICMNYCSYSQEGPEKITMALLKDVVNTWYSQKPRKLVAQQIAQECYAISTSQFAVTTTTDDVISCVENDNSRSSFAFRRRICEETFCNNLFSVPLFLRVLFCFIPFFDNGFNTFYLFYFKCSWHQ